MSEASNTDRNDEIAPADETACAPSEPTEPASGSSAVADEEPQAAPAAPVLSERLDRERREREAEERRRRSAEAAHRRLKFMLPFLALLTFAVYAFTTNFIPSKSMLPTLKPGDHILTMRTWLAYPRGAMPRIGDVVVFVQPRSLDSPADALNGGGIPRLFFFRNEDKPLLIKRVVALPGQWVHVVHGNVYVNGRPSPTDYDTLPSPLGGDSGATYAVRRPYQVPPGRLFVMGDNRGNSEDSRFIGPIKCSAIVGRFVRVLWNEGPNGPNEERARQDQLQYGAD